MQVFIRRDDFSIGRYDLQPDEQALAFSGEEDSFSLPYQEVRDFCIVQDRRDKTYFTILGKDRLYEGRISNPEEIKSFTAQLKERLGGILQIQVRRN